MVSNNYGNSGRFGLIQPVMELIRVMTPSQLMASSSNVLLYIVDKTLYFIPKVATIFSIMAPCIKILTVNVHVRVHISPCIAQRAN